MKSSASLISSITALLPSFASAAAFRWIGATDGNWNTGPNWDVGVPASAADTALIFDNAVQLAIANNIPGGLTLNALWKDTGTKRRNSPQTPTAPWKSDAGLSFARTGPVAFPTGPSGSLQ